MVNELKTICRLLEGYSEEKSFEVLSAQKTAEGKWELVIQRVEPKAEKSQEDEDADK